MLSAQPMPESQVEKPHDEQQLVARAIDEQRTGRKNEAFAILYQSHVDRVYGYVLARVANVADAQDLTAQTFLIALQKISHYRGEGRFAAWLMGIAHHKVIDHYRQSKTILSLEYIDEVGQHAPPIEDIIGQQLRIERVIMALSAISPERAEALTLNIFGGLKLAEVGQVMGKSESAAKMLVHRALKDLRERLNPVDGDEENG